MKTLEVAGGIILNHEGLVLLGQRPEGKRLGGYWEFPGGKIEPGETAEDALARELKEELRLDVQILKEIGYFTHTYEWGVIGLHVLAVLALNPPSLTADVQAMKWLKAHEIDTSTLAPADIPALKVYLDQVAASGPLVR